MNLTRIALAAMGAFVVYFILGGLMFAVMPFLREELSRYPAVYRNQDVQMSHMAVGMPATFVVMVVLAVIYAMLYRGGISLADSALSGAAFGSLIGIFSVCGFVIHNYVNLNIGLTLTLQQAAVYFVESDRRRRCDRPRLPATSDVLSAGGKFARARTSAPTLSRGRASV